MKTRLLVIGLVLMAGQLFADGAEPTDGDSDGKREVSTLDHLLWISTNTSGWDYDYEQTADIDASATSIWNGNAGWSPIGNSTTTFTGSYNGQSHTISGLTISRGTTDCQGLFGHTSDATIQNLGVTNVNITGKKFVGGLVGYNNSSTVSSCYSTGAVSGLGNVGGLVGQNFLSSIVSSCYSTCAVSGSSNNAGGLVGINYNLVSNCYSRGGVTRSSGSGVNFGGFLGYNASKIQYCYSTGSVDCGGATDKGFSGTSSGTWIANFFDSQTSGQITGTGATAKSTTEMQTQSTFTDAGWDFASTWQMSGYPTLRSNPETTLPVGLTSFAAQVKGKSVVLDWITESEVGNLGFILERSGEDGIWVQIASYQTDEELQVQGNTSSATEYSFIDANVEPGKEYSYRLSDVSGKGVITRHAPISVSLNTDVSPQTTTMENAFPNPFNPQTYIAYRLAENSDVSIAVFDMLGRQIKTLHNGFQRAGSYHVYWNGTSESGTKAPSGNYVIRMQTENSTQIQKVMFVK